MAEVFLPVKNIGQGGRIPPIGVVVRMVSGSFGMMPFFVCRRNQHFFVRKRLTDLRKTGTAGCHIEDSADNGSCFLIYMKSLLITGNPLITVGYTAAAPFAILHPRFEHSADFIAGILCEYG